MKRIQALRQVFFVLFTAALLCATAFPGEEKRELESTVADNALFMMRFSGMDSLNPALHKTGQHKLWRDPRIKRFFEKPLSELQKRIDEMRKDLSERSKGKLDIDPDEILGMLGGEMLFVLETPEDGTFDSEADLSFYFAAKVGDSAERLSKLLQNALEYHSEKVAWREKDHNGVRMLGVFPKDVDEDASATERNPINYALVDGYFIAALKIGTLERAIDSLKTPPEKLLVDTETYKRFAKEIAPESVTVYFLDIAKLYASLPEPKGAAAGEAPAAGDEGVLEINDNAPKPVDYRDILNALGLSDLDFAGGWAWLDKDGISYNGMFLHDTSEPTGLMLLGSQSQAKMDVPAFLPKTTAAYSTMRFSPAAFYDLILTTVDAARPGTSSIFEMRMAMIKAQNGIDIRGEFLASMGEELGVIIIPPQMQTEIDFGNLNPMMAQAMLSSMQFKSMAFTLEIKDMASFQSILTVLLAQLGDKAPMYSNITQEPIGELTVNQLGGQGIPGMPVPSYMLTKKRFFFAFDSQILRNIAKQIESGKDGMADQEALKTALSKLPDKPATMLQCMDVGAYVGHQFGFAKASLQIANVKLQQEMGDADDAAQTLIGPEGEAIAKPDTPLAAILQFIDFDTWPERAVYSDYLGYSVSRAYPVKDGIRLEAVQIPNPDAPDPEAVVIKEPAKTEAAKTAPEKTENAKEVDNDW